LSHSIPKRLSSPADPLTAEQEALAILRHLQHQGAQIKRPGEAILEIVQELAKDGL
jgi:hypothetical protein